MNANAVPQRTKAPHSDAQKKTGINILVIEDNDFDKAYLKTLLETDQDPIYNLVFVSSITLAIMRTRLEKFDLIILDFNLPDGTAPEFIKNFKESIDAPIIVITAYKLKKIENLILSSGATDYIPKDELKEDLLKRSIRFSIERHKQYQNIKKQTLLDPLTGCYNRSALEQLFETKIKTSSKKNLLSAVLMIDFDGFKNINETYGHFIGDQALKASAATMHEMANEREETDFLVRYGGDQFIYGAAHQQTREQITHIAERLIKLHAKPFSIQDEKVSLPLSIGIAVHNQSSEHLEPLIRQADAALYRAKRTDGSSYEISE